MPWLLPAARIARCREARDSDAAAAEDEDSPVHFERQRGWPGRKLTRCCSCLPMHRTADGWDGVELSVLP